MVYAVQVETEHQLGVARAQIMRLEERVRECEVIPGLRRDLKQARSQVEQLRGKCKALRVSASCGDRHLLCVQLGCRAVTAAKPCPLLSLAPTETCGWW